jgi:protein-disulfide isomerase
MSKRFKGLAVALAAILISPAIAGTDDLGVCKQLDELLTEVREIKKMLSAKPAAAAPIQVADAVMDLTGVPSIGSSKAAITLVEFTDYQCPYCRRFYSGTFPDLKKRYLDTGKIRFYSMDFPLDIHANAMLAAQAAHCAAENGKFWELNDKLRMDADALDRENLAGYAQASLIDPATFLKCLDSGRFREDINRSIEVGAALGVRGTPTFVIGRSTERGLKEGSLLIGAIPVSAIESKMEAFSQ